MELLYFYLHNLFYTIEFLAETGAEDLTRKQTVLYNIISLLKQLNVDIIAEGIETKEQAEFLLQAGCKIGQGYLYSKPLPLQDFEKYYLY